MKPPVFEYHAPGTIDEALALLAEHGDGAKVLAGGQSFVPTMNFRLAQPEVLVDLNRIGELFYVRAEGDEVRVGAMTRQRTVERDPLIAERVPLVHGTMPYISHPQIRNRGTFGGSIAHSDPAAELPAVSLALGARMRVRSRSGERWVAAEEFFTGLFETALAPDELLVEVALPRAATGSGWGFQELSRRHGDYALVGVAATVPVDSSGRCEDARIAFLSVGEGPELARRAGEALRGEAPTAEVLRAAAERAAGDDVDPPGDIHASAAYRRHLVRVLTGRVLAEAFERASTAG